MATFQNQTKNSATATNTTKTVVVNPSFLQKQDGGYLLLQDGYKIILSQSGGYPSWSNTVKS